MIHETEGIPNVVQEIRYNYFEYFVEATMFDGVVVKFEPEELVQDVGLMTRQLTDEQYVDAYNNATKLIGERHEI